MTRINWQEYITIDKEIHHGEPCIKGTRLFVAVIVGSIADNMTMEEIIKEYPQLKRESNSARAGLSRRRQFDRRLFCRWWVKTWHSGSKQMGTCREPLFRFCENTAMILPMSLS